ncbi:coronin-1C-like isoform X1 [Haliotis cracherodii]|uniref:coronin-1C-like isoform X1 n=1 Tax=Haliotis cracherodii TaxID=6455 RepID=UPI0039ED7199
MFMRKSKFRHVFGQALKRDQCYDNIRITKSSWDSRYCDVNPKYVAVITEAAGGGSFLVVPLSKVGRVERDSPLVSGHKAAVLDISWCPHNDDVIASASEDCTIKIWQIPEGGLTKSLTEPVVDLVAHQRRVSCVKWHPTAHNVLLSAGSDNKIYIWNVGTGEVLNEIDLPDLPLCASFNFNGSKFACTCKDKKLRVFNARTGDCLQEGAGHAGAKPAQVVYLKDGHIFSTGFSRMSERQYALWDEKDMSKPKEINELDNSNGVMFPLYDADVNMVYLCGKGDSQIRYFEVTDEEPYVHYLNTYQSKEAGRGVGFMSKRGLNVNNCEIARIYKLHNSGLCEVIPFTVPRKSELFQDDLYPDTPSDTPALSAEEWFAGKDADPIMVSLKGGFVSTRKDALKVVRRSNVLDKMPSRTSQAQSTNSEAAAAAVLPPISTTSTPPDEHVSLPEGFDPKEVMEELKKLKATVKSQEKLICGLEKRVATLETQTSEEEVKDD